MKWTFILCMVLCVIAAAIVIGLIIFLVRRKTGKRRVCRMCMQEKLQLLEELAEPFGFSYVPEADVFTGRIDAWQRAAGYEALFDRAAPHFHMIFDAWPVYFDYEGKTWLIELWKGQYGINTGAEVGVYHANQIIPEKKQKRAHYGTVKNKEMPEICFRLEKKGDPLFCLRRRHWWLAAFRMGEFSRPKDLKLVADLEFRDLRQAEEFYEGLSKSGYPEDNYRICCNEVSVCMDFHEKHCLCMRIYRGFIQLLNLIFCKLFLLITRPFCCTADRLLFLYFQLPRCFRIMLRRLAGKKRRYCK